MPYANVLEALEVVCQSILVVVKAGCTVMSSKLSSTIFSGVGLGFSTSSPGAAGCVGVGLLGCVGVGAGAGLGCGVAG